MGSERLYAVDFHGPDHLWPGLRWNLVTALFDTDELVPGEDVHIRVQGLEGGGVDEPLGGPFIYDEPFDPLLSQDIAQPGVWFALGGGLWSAEANSVLDEFAIYDFGDDASAACNGSAAWAQERFSRGRYYKGNDGSFLSARQTPAGAAPARLLSVRWTACLPQARRPVIRMDASGSFPPEGEPRQLDPRLVGAALEMELLDGNGDPLVPPRILAQVAPLGDAMSAYRYRATFRTNLADPLNDPVLETPFLDDITLCWQPVSGPRVLSWRED